MGQNWVAIAIVVGCCAALVWIFLNRKPSRDAKAGDKAKAAGKTEKSASAGAPVPARGTKDGAKAEKAKTEKEAADSSMPARAVTVPDPAVQRKAVPSAMLVDDLHDDDDDDITIVTLAPRLDLKAAAEAALPDASGLAAGDDEEEDDDEERAPESPRSGAVPIIYDEDAAVDEPTHAKAVILVSASGQTDRGQKRKVNEDRYLVLDDMGLFVVADGMGGHAGGEIASQLAVDTIAEAFTEQNFEGEPYDNVPRRGGELALAIQMANRAIYEKSRREPKLAGMGTTIVSARFTPGKERVYIGHVGDSRCYRFRSGQLTQITTDHTMAAIGMTGPFADHLSRAVGIAPAVKVDLVIAKPRHEDVYILCSDGLSKMVKDDGIAETLNANPDPNEALKALVERANAKGGRDNITVILVVVKDPKGFARYAQQQERKRKLAEARAAEAAATGTNPSLKALAAGLKEGAAATGEVPAAPAEAKASAPAEAKPETPADAKPADAKSDSKDAPSDAKPADVEPAPATMKEASLAKEASPAPAPAKETSPVPAPAKETSPVPAPAKEASPVPADSKPRPSVPPRPEPRSVPPPRPSAPEARKSSPENRVSSPDLHPAIPEPRKSGSEPRATVPAAPKPSSKKKKPPPLTD